MTKVEDEKVHSFQRRIVAGVRFNCCAERVTAVRAVAPMGLSAEYEDNLMI